MRVHDSAFAAAKRLNFHERYLRAISRASRSIQPAEAAVARNFNRTLCVTLVVVLLAASSPTAVPTVVGAVKGAERSAVSWLRTSALSAKLYRGVAYSYFRYRSLSASLDSGSTRSPDETPRAAAVAALASPVPVVLNAPSNVAVTSTTNTLINLSWTAPTGTVAHYRVERSQSLAGPFFDIANAPTTTHQDTTVSAGIAYLYRVRAVDSSGVPSTPSTMVLGTAITFTDPTLYAGTTQIKKQHIYDLRQSVNAVRTLAGVGTFAWTYPDLTGLQVQALHIQQLRDKLDQALQALIIPVTTYEDHTLAIGTSGTFIKKRHIEQLRERSTSGSSSSTGPAFSDGDLQIARLDPMNRTGGGGADPLSRNFNWNVPLVGLPGRSGLALGLSLSYNSLVWTKSGSFISFYDDKGFPTPGFRLGFPVIQTRYFNSQVGKWAYLLITPSGGRVELRQIGVSNVYESADSSYLQLTDGGTLTLLTTDGTRASFSLMSGEYRCTEVKDRNGNYLTVAYFGDGRLDKITDTLGRTITFNYDTYQNLISITQPWKRQTEANPTGLDEVHTWATFSYTNLTLQPSFSGLTVVGPQPGTVIPVIERVFLSDGSYYKLSYNGWGQVWKVTHYAADSVIGSVPQDTHALSYTRLNLPGSDLAAATPQTDCPRFTEQRTWVENGVMNQSAEVMTSYSPWTPNMASCDVTVPDGTVHRELYATTADGWKKGLTIQSEVWSAGQRMKWTTLLWEHDGAAGEQFMTNPRVYDSTVNDYNNKHRRTSFTYTSFGLPQEVTEYAANTTTALRTTRTEYNVPNLSEYHSRRIIGLPKFQYLYEGTATGALLTKVGYEYDDPTLPDGYLNALPSAATQHDGANYGTGLRWRGNANRVRRYDVTGGVSTYVESQVSYNVTGTVAFSKDAGGHKISVTYADSFYQSVNRSNPVLQTFAYPTTVTDADFFTSSTWYNYDMGVVTESETPQPNVTTDQEGPKLKRLYDSAGRGIQVTNSFNAARRKWVYPSSMNLVQTFTLIDVEIQPNLEAYSASYLDGVGRVRASVSNLPDSDGGYSGQIFQYDAMGRLAGQSNPTETTGAGTWPATGNDASAGWLYTQQTYDWKGRPLITTYSADGTTKEASYDGCGCAGGEVVTLTDEGTLVDTDPGWAINHVTKKRQQKIYSDVLGRTVKIEVLNWNGPGPFGTDDPAIYSTTIYTYDARDQVKLVRQFQGAGPTDLNDLSCPTGTCQQTTMNYDGHGRLATRHAPEQTVGTNTLWEYYDDDTIRKLTDARAASQTFTYNSRHLVAGITYGAPAGITVPAAPSFGYDAAGNRISMTDGLGSVSYAYDQMSRTASESRTFTGTGTFNLSYQYNLADGLKRITDPSGSVVDYTHDAAGRLIDVSGTGYGSFAQFASEIQYRAWGGLTHLKYGNNVNLDQQYDTRLRLTRYALTAPISGEGFVHRAQDYQYYNDSRIKFVQDEHTNLFDRSYAFDQAGKLTAALTGYEARGEQFGGVSAYKETFQYDEWGNLKHRFTRHWNDQHLSSPIVYQDNRQPNYIYDADGRVAADHLNTSSPGTINYSYDARGVKVSARKGDNSHIATHSFDGEGRLAKIVDTTTEQSVTTTITTYEIRSSVLGGAVIEKVNEQGAKNLQYVYTSSGVELANGKAETTMTFIHRDPVIGVEQQSWTNGLNSGRTELDPMAADVGTYPPLEDDPGQDFPMGFGSPSEPFDLCSINYLPSDCQSARLAAQGEGAVVLFVRGGAPGGGGSTRVVYSPSGIPQFIPAWTPSYSADVWKWIPYTGEGAGEGAFAPEPTIYSGMEYFEALPEKSSSFFGFAQRGRPVQHRADRADVHASDCRVQAMLEAIAWAEGTDSDADGGYGRVVRGTVLSAPNNPQLVGQSNVTITNFTSHPNITVHVRAGLDSTAAGRYQFLHGTWTGLNLPDFGAENQDLGAVILLVRAGSINPLLRGDVRTAASNANGTWASLPNSPHGQPTQTMIDFQAAYNNANTACQNRRGGWRAQP